HNQPEDSNELFQKLFKDLKELAVYKESLENSSNEIATSNQEKGKPSQDSNISQLIREECSIKVCEEQKQNMEDTILDLIEICQEKELFCMHDNVDDLTESALDFKLLSINSQRLDKEKQEVKNVVEQPAERGNHNDDLTSSDDESLSEEDVSIEESKVYPNPLFDDDEMNSDELESYIDYLEEFSGELAHINPEIMESNFDFEEEIRLIENLLYDNSSPRPEEINIVTETDDVLPPSVENDDDLEEDTHFLKELLCDNSIPLTEDESSDFDHQDASSIPLPHLEPPDAEFDFELDAKISVMMNTIDEFEYLDPKDEFDDYYSFMFVIRIFLPFLIYFKMFLSFLSAESEDTIFDPEIPSGEIKLHIEVLSVLWGNRLPIRMVRCRCLGKHKNKSKTDKSLCILPAHNRCYSLLKGQGSPSRNKTPGPWSARAPMWQLFKGLGDKEQMDEEDNRELKRLSESQDDKMAKKQKLDEEVKELKRHLQIVPNDEDDVYTEAASLARKVPFVDYEIYNKHNKQYYKIKRANGSHQLYLSFLCMLRNFDREDLEALCRLVKVRFATTKPKNFSDDFLLITLGAMFKKPDIQAQIWKNQRSVYVDFAGREEISTYKVHSGSDAQLNTGYSQEPSCEESPVEAIATSPPKTKKVTKARQKRMIQSDDASRQIMWTHEEEIALAKGWVDVFENSRLGNSRKEAGF
nr:hypothetical protein [Tanacetum cinerariifolium]